MSEVPSLKGRYKINDEKNYFVIPGHSSIDNGIYTCSIPEIGESAQIKLIGEFLVSLMTFFLYIHYIYV